MMHPIKNTWVILAAGGSGSRFEAAVPKQFLSLNGRSLLEHSLELCLSVEGLGGVVVVLPREHLKAWQKKLGGGGDIPLRFAEGGATRQQSVQNGLREVDPEAEWIAVHDAARPLLSQDILERCLAEALETGAAVAAVPVADTIKKGAPDGKVLETVSREGLYRIQTPQVFRKKLLQESLDWARVAGVDATDEAALFEKMGRPVRWVLGSEFNFKITRPEDLALAEAILMQRGGKTMGPQMRIGQGYDVHALVSGRDFILGGVKIPFELGLQGHSDADALLHAIGDALLGAVAEGDLGRHFPDTDPKFQGASSLLLLGEVAGILKKKGFQVLNVDATLICQRPKLAPHIPAMRENIARVLKVSLDRVSVKATTEEGLGFTGKMEGLAAKAVVLVQGPQKD